MQRNFDALQAPTVPYQRAHQSTDRPQETGDRIWSSDVHAVVRATFYERYCIFHDCQLWKGRCRTKVSIMFRIVQKRQP